MVNHSKLSTCCLRVSIPCCSVEDTLTAWGSNAAKLHVSDGDFSASCTSYWHSLAGEMYGISFTHLLRYLPVFALYVHTSCLQILSDTLTKDNFWSASSNTCCRRSDFEKTSIHPFPGNWVLRASRIRHWSIGLVPHSPAAPLNILRLRVE